MYPVFYPFKNMFLYHEKTLCEINRNNITNSNSCYWNRFSWYLISFTVTFRDHTWILHEKVFKCFAQFFFQNTLTMHLFHGFKLTSPNKSECLIFQRALPHKYARTHAPLNKEGYLSCHIHCYDTDPRFSRSRTKDCHV